MKKEVQEAINTIKTFLGMEKEVKLAQEVLEAVSYTHLTLPTKA